MASSNGAASRLNGGRNHGDSQALPPEVVITYRGDEVISGSKRAVLTGFYGVMGWVSAMTAIAAFSVGVAVGMYAMYTQLQRHINRQAAVPSISIGRVVDSFHAANVVIVPMTSGGYTAKVTYHDQATGARQTKFIPSPTGFADSLVPGIATLLEENGLDRVVLRTDCLSTHDIGGVVDGIGYGRVAFYSGGSASCNSF